jgi:hypothetical protein
MCAMSYLAMFSGAADIPAGRRVAMERCLQPLRKPTIRRCGTTWTATGCCATCSLRPHAEGV